MPWRSLVGVGGLAAVLIGVVGLITPVPIHVESVHLLCGTAIAPGSSAAADAFGDEPVAEESDDLCQTALRHRRLWTVGLTTTGVVVLIAAAVHKPPYRRSLR